MFIEFINYQRDVKGLQRSTLIEYTKSLTDFQTWFLDNIPGCRWNNVTLTVVNGYVADLSQRKIEPATIRARVSAIRTYSKWQYMTQQRTEDWARYAQTPKLRQKTMQIADLDVVRAYLQAVPTDADDRRLKAITALMLTTGLRISEALAVKTSDIDKAKKRIHIVGKGLKERYVYYQADTAAYLNKMLGRCSGLLFDGWTARDCRESMYQHMRAQGRGYHPHMLRHLFATTMIDEGVDLHTLADLLGHTTIKTTEKYLHTSSTRASQATAQGAPRLTA